MVPRGEKELKEFLTEEEFFNYKFYFTPEVQTIMQTTARLLEDKPNTIKFNNLTHRRARQTIKQIYEAGVAQIEGRKVLG